MSIRSMEEEKVLRKKTQVFVFDCCKMLKTKSLVMCAAMTICHRYFSQVSFRRINRVVRANVPFTPLQYSNYPYSNHTLDRLYLYQYLIRYRLFVFVQVLNVLDYTRRLYRVSDRFFSYFSCFFFVSHL